MTLQQTRRDAYQTAVKRLTDGGIITPQLDARVLLGAILEMSSGGVLIALDAPMTDRERALYETYIDRRCAHEPVARILGIRQFWGLDFCLSPDALVPRPDTETLIESAIHRYPDRNRTHRVLDLGTGSGCLLISLLTMYPNASGVGIDCAPGALITARENADRLGVGDRCTFKQGSWDGAAPDLFDIILSNPPYIPRTEEESLSPDVRLFDPERALYGGVDGLSAYRALAPILPSLLAPGGTIFLEIGQGQRSDVTQLMAQAGLACVGFRSDLQGIDRCGIFIHDGR